MSIKKVVKKRRRVIHGRTKRNMMDVSPVFKNLVWDLQVHYKKKGKVLSQKQASKIIAHAFKKREFRLEDNFIWL